MSWILKIGSVFLTSMEALTLLGVVIGALDILLGFF